MDDKVYSETPIEIKQEYDECEEVTNDDWKFRADKIKARQNPGDMIDNKISADSTKNMNCVYDRSLETRNNEGLKTEFKQEHEEIGETHNCEELEVKHEEFSINQEHDSLLEIKDEIDIEYDIEVEKTCYSYDKTEFQCSYQLHIDSSHRSPSSQPEHLKSFANKSGKKQHCKNSGDMFKSDRDLKANMKQQTGKRKSKYILNAENKYECQICYKVYNNTHSLMHHVKAIHANIKYECESCHKNFCYKRNLDMHISAMHNGARYECEVCRKTFCYKGNLNKHTSMMHKAVEHECDICRKTFSYKIDFHKHVKQVHGTTKYECKVCGKTYDYKYEFNNHVKAVHDGIKHECDICHSTFDYKCNLLKHMSLKHKAPTRV